MPVKKQKIVVKLGTTTLTEETERLSQRNMLEIAGQIAKIHESGHQVVLVTSGSIAAGKEVLPDAANEKAMPVKQMLAAVGQVRLMHLWAELFHMYGIAVGQVLLTQADLANRTGYLNIRNTLQALMERRVIPIINENDTIATDEIKVGDNDNLSALTANLIAADLLILLTDQAGLYTADPRRDPNASIISEVKKIEDKHFAMAGKSSAMGTGGMITKLEAAQLATNSGTTTVIASYAKELVLIDIVRGKSIGTRFLSETTPKESYKRWLISEKPQGKIQVDDGAEAKLKEGGASLLPVGIKKAVTKFDRGAIVHILNMDGKPIATGIANYSSHELELIKGLHSGEIDSTLGYTYGPEFIHRDHLVLLGG